MNRQKHPNGSLARYKNTKHLYIITDFTEFLGYTIYATNLDHRTGQLTYVYHKDFEKYFTVLSEG